MRILLQFPEGLKREALKYQEKYEEEGHEVFTASAPCYGACDLALEEAGAIGAAKLVHFGHAKFVQKDLPVEVEYIPYHVDVNLPGLKDAISQLKQYQNIALATTIQHIHQFAGMKQLFGQTGHTVFAGKGNVAAYAGQVLGCDSLAIKSVEKHADALVFVGDGMFHALAIDFETDKPIFVIHPQSGQLRKINDEIEKLRKKRKGAVLAAVDARTFGILVSTKSGQFRLDTARNIKKELEKRGKRAMILVSNELKPLALNNFMLFDCYITTACPRTADDGEEFGKPVLTASMLQEVFKITDNVKTR